MGSEKPISTKTGQSKQAAPASAKSASESAPGARFSAKLALQRAFVAAPTD